MLKFILPLVLALIGAGAGVGAGLFLSGGEDHAADAAPVECAPPVPEADHSAPPPARVDAEALEDREFVKLPNQFVLPVVTETRVAALVVLSVTIETRIGTSEVVYAREPKLRDLFLQALFDQASTGRFSGEFATAANLRPLRDELLIIARRVLGDTVSDVLITEISRQDA